MHSDKHACLNSWRQIGGVLGVDGDTCQKKWKSVRDRYVRARRKMLEKRSGDGAEDLFCPAVVKRLSWLQNYIFHRSTDTNFPRSPIPDEEPPSPGVMSPGPVSPGPMSPSPVSLGPVSPSPVSPGPISPGPVSPGPMSPSPVSPSPVSPGPVSSSVSSSQLSTLPTPTPSTSTEPSTPSGEKKRKARKRALETDTVDAALLKRLDEIREERQSGQNLYANFGRYVGSFLQELPQDSAKRLMREMKQLMEVYEL
ncbi:mucin-7-like [Myripristis murdjan]|uniref:mucin-7-like n=1 Tax=Myripristis murdjan TaxID=586833 RepID=UPI001176158D|nr:mucin-7-like [Myripristis murdjan]